MIPPGLAFISVSAKAWAQNETARLPRLYFDLRREKKMADKGESAWTPNVSHILALAEALAYIRQLGTELEFVIMVIAVSCVKLLSAHNSTQHTSRKHKV
jgi:L-aspartate aminotransferase apoenzyme (EC 2.6.1.1)/phosphoserine aminotransferase apoenzyme (EC 2.6.1.52)